MQAHDVLIAGGGIAGLYAALQFPKDIRVLLLTKGEADISGSALAQGGIAAVLEHKDDSYELHFDDTIVAGGYKNDHAAVEQLIREGPAAVRNIIRLGVDFDSGADGILQKTLEGGHSRRRIMHRKDQTGAEIIRALWERVRERPNVTVRERTALCSLSALPDGFGAEITHTVTHESEALRAGFVILATGGIGQAYRYTTNPAISTGDGIRLAYLLGAKIKNLHFVQFHPTAMPAERQETRDKRQDDESCLLPLASCFLVSEALRGEGALLINRDGERFMGRYDERLELAPRDVVSRAIINESKRLGGDTRFYLDITHRGSEWLEKRFPAIFAECARRGLDMGKDPIPVFPCQHYLMGGIDVDLDGKTTVPRLYAAGECAHTGLHGANRLASNSLPEALVWGRRAALDILRCIRANYTMPQAAAPSTTPALRATPPEEGNNVINTQIPLLWRGAPQGRGGWRAAPQGGPGPRPEEGQQRAINAESAINLAITDKLQFLIDEIREILQSACFVFADNEAIPAALERVNEICAQLEAEQSEGNPELCEAQSIALMAKLILEGHQGDSIYERKNVG